MNKGLYFFAGAASLALASQGAMATCNEIPDLTTAYATAAGKITGGYQAPAGLNMWLTAVDETGKVCQVVTKNPGTNAGNSAWLGSRVISAQKAFTANAFSLDGYAISTANLFTPVQGGNSLFGLQFSNPVDASAAYLGDPKKYGTGKKDPLVGKRIGGVNVFGGGLALYKGGKKVGAIGVSGDTSCRDHAYAWQVRTALNMHPLNNGQFLPNASGGAGQAYGTGITTYNIDKDGNVKSAGTLVVPAFKNGAAKYGDEMILKASGDSLGDLQYWQDNWAHPVCGAGSITNIVLPNTTSVRVDTTDNGILTLE